MTRTFLLNCGVGVLVVSVGCSAPAGTSGGAAPVYYDLASGAPTDAVVAAEDGTAPADTQGAAGTCSPCVSNDECLAGFRCAQAADSSYCLAECGGALPACQASEQCSLVSDTEGKQAQVCASTIQTCGGTPVVGPDSGATDPADAGVDTGVDTGPSPGNCAGFADPATAACCVCGAGKTCATNGCYNGWLCNLASCKCNPAPATCDSADASPPTDTAAPDVPVSNPGDDVVDNSGGVLSSLDFAMVGDTRPPTPNSIALYPKAIIGQLWADVEAEAPHLAFAMTTGDYQFSTAKSTSGAPQFDLYLAAQKAFTGKVFYALGNHECTGATASNCGTGNANGLTATYLSFQQKLLAPIGQTLPYYTLNFKHKDGKWTAKFVVVAANAWDGAQAAWLDAELAKPTTYTFVVRHEGDLTTEAPGVVPSGNLLKKYPFTLLLAGHTHTYEYFPGKKEVILGNGGAPLATAINYGYGVMRQHADLNLEFNVYDYASHAVLGHFVVKPNGVPVP